MYTRTNTKRVRTRRMSTRAHVNVIKSLVCTASLGRLGPSPFGPDRIHVSHICVQVCKCQPNLPTYPMPMWPCGSHHPACHQPLRTLHPHEMHSVAWQAWPFGHDRIHAVTTVGVGLPAQATRSAGRVAELSHAPLMRMITLASFQQRWGDSSYKHARGQGQD